MPQLLTVAPALALVALLVGCTDDEPSPSGSIEGGSTSGEGGSTSGEGGSTSGEGGSTAGDPEPEDPPPPPYEGLGLVNVDSPLFLDSAALERTLEQGYRLSLPTDRLLPRVEGMGDAADLVGWFVYRLGVGTEWSWLRLAIYAPADARERMPGAGTRVEVGRTGAWHGGGADGPVALGVGEAHGALKEGARAVCGGATVAARVTLRPPAGDDIPGALAVGQLVSPRSTLAFDWLRGCGLEVIPR